MEDVFAVLQLRMPLKTFSFRKHQRKLIRQHLKKFDVTFGPLTYSQERDDLYKQHENRFEGVVYDSLIKYFQEDEKPKLFDTYECRVYDKETRELVAISFFDRGENSIAGILAVYNQEIPNTSLGYFTLLMEAQYALENNYKYYYPGYILNRGNKFNYKLRLGEMQFYNPNTRRWGYRKPNYEPFDIENTRLGLREIKQHVSEKYAFTNVELKVNPLSVHFTWDYFTDVIYIISPVILEVLPNLLISRSTYGEWFFCEVLMQQDITKTVVKESQEYNKKAYSWKVYCIHQKIMEEKSVDSFLEQFDKMFMNYYFEVYLKAYA